MKEDRVLGLLLVQSLNSLVVGSECRKKLSGLMSTRPLLNLWSIPRRICCLRCSRLVHFKYSSMDVTVPGDLSVQLLVTYWLLWVKNPGERQFNWQLQD